MSLSRGNVANSVRLDNEGPFGNGWTRESVTLFTLQRKSKWYLYGAGTAGAL